MNEPEFLDLEDALSIHAMQLERFGGLAGLRDRGLLESALAQPRASFGGQFLHEDLFAMAAAYLYHIAANHPFLDGNKRAALLCALVFLDLNGVLIDRASPELYDTTIGVAEGRLGKDEVAAVLSRLAGQAGEG